MLNSILATFVVCLGMSKNGMPISNYDDQEKTQIATTLQPKKLTQETTNTLNISNITYDSYPYAVDHYDRQTYGEFSQNQQGINLTGQYTCEYYVEVDWNTNKQSTFTANKWDLMNFAQYGIDYDINNFPMDTTTIMMYSMKIEPTNYNKDTSITTQMLIGNTLLEGQDGLGIPFMIMTLQSTDNAWNNYINVSQRQDVSLYKYKNLTDNNNLANYTKKYEIKELYSIYDPISEGRYYELNIPIDVVANQTNYIYVFIFPTNADYELGSSQTDYMAIETPLELRTNSIDFSNTNVIPEGNMEVIDLPGLMFNILTMPFSFISQAFNITLFPGTEYQLNLSNLFLVIIAVLLIIAILRMLIKAGMFSVGG